MLSLLPILTLAQTAVTSAPVVPPALPSPPPAKIRPLPDVVPPQEQLQPQDQLQLLEVFQPQDIRPLPGQLDTVPVFNSNSPEMVLTEGILLSTFPPQGKATPEAHLNMPFQGRFDVFSHHISRARTPSEARSLFQGLLIYNPTFNPITLQVLQGASYLTRPDALFVDLPSYVEDPTGRVYAGPGSRVVNDLLRGRRQGALPPTVEIPPGRSFMLLNLPIPAGTVTPTSNGRSTLLRLWSSGPVYVANMAMFAPRTPEGNERVPTLEEWETLLVNGKLAGPRDIPPTPMDPSYARVTYGRVAGVAVGSQWQANLTDNPKTPYLSVPKRGTAFSYGLSTLYRGTLGTGQIQSAKLLKRYPDTAYQAHGNYGIQYNLTMPLYNNTGETQTVTIALQTPLKEDKTKGGLLFYKPPEDRVFFRGPVRLRYIDDSGKPQTRFVHVIQQRGQQGEPLLTLKMPPGDRRLVEVDLLYPPDSTPPQVLTVRSLGN
jgi:hypothetical protein